ncbi:MULTISPECIES: histidine kinase [Actinoplanes]|uniref:histidine kinase n=1 Tax=Actinoplanes TaxID=1865 RepID=UPI000695DCF8|nr:MULTISPECIES: histidine kinase [Actinoplanes]GLY04557.1 hypothetical protein Acsp01_49360 [Actinoplanes sp. NBRC 101535]
MRPAIFALTVAAYLTLLTDVATGRRSELTLAPASAFLLTATWGFSAVRRRASRVLSAGYLTLLAGLGGAVLLTSAGVAGATPMLIVVVIAAQAVLLLPLRAIVPAVLLLPILDLGLFTAAILAVALTTAVTREQQARAELAAAHGRLREYAIQVEHLATVQDRYRVARDVHDGLGHALTVVQVQIRAARALLVPQPDRAEQMLVKAQEQTEEALREVSRSLGEPPEPPPDDLETHARRRFDPADRGARLRTGDRSSDGGTR